MEEVDRYYQGNITLEEAENYIASGLITAARAYVANGYYLRRIRDDRLYEEAGYKNFEEYVRAKYNKDKGWASKCIKVNQELSADGNSPILISNYQDYSVYQLVEIAYMTEEQREEADPDMTVQALKEIRNPKPRAEEKVVTSQLEERPAEPEPDAEAQQTEESIAISQQDPEILSAYGTSMKVYPEDSLLTTPGCEGGHDCFLCHLQCDIRQEYCRCVEATTGNPFPCEQIDRIDTLREEIGKRCQFIDLDQAFHRAGDHEPVPCCKECNDPCQYACQRSVQKREAEEQICNTDPSSCPHRDGYNCTLTPDQKNTPGDGNQCERSCCWECKYHGMCEPECDSSAGRDGERPEFDAAWFVRKWVERFPNDLKAVMRICREQLSNADRAKAVQKYISPYGARCQCCWEYDFSFHGFAGGVDFRIGRVQIHLKYGRFVTELLALYDPSSPEYDEEPVKEVPEEEPDPVIDAEYEEVPEPGEERKQIGDMELSCRTENILKRAGIDTVTKLVSMSDEELTAVRGMSNRAMEEIKAKLEDLDSVDKPEAVIDAEFEEVPEQPEPEESTTDLQVVRQMLEKENRLLNTCLLTVPDPNNIHIRKMKLRVAALAAFVCDLDNIENPLPKPEQPELPLLKNNDQRAAFVDAYETWPLWIETAETGERYYRYDLPDGTSMVVKVYHAMIFAGYADGSYKSMYHEGYGMHEYYLLKPGKFFRDCESNRSTLIDKLKEIQKKEKA